MGKIEVDTYRWDNSEKEISKEKRMVEIIKGWAEVETPPIDISVNTYLGLYITIRPFEFSVEDIDKHKLLAWVVKRSGKKFFKTVRGESELIWCNSSSNGHYIFKDEHGELKMHISIENAALGKCRFVTKEKVVKYTELVCDEAEA